MLRMPLSSIIGQEHITKAVTFLIIHPDINYVLLLGDKGTAKTTSAKALLDYLGTIDMVTGCRFQCDPYDVMNLCSECEARMEEQELSTNTIERPFVIANPSVSMKGLVGTVMKGKDGVLFNNGLLARANRGILFMDEISHYSEDILDKTYSVAEEGTNLVKEGNLEFEHPAKFKIIATHDTESGYLPNEVVWRFDVVVKTRRIDDIEERMEIARRSMEFKNHPQAFIERYEAQEEKAMEAIFNARKHYKKVIVPKKIKDEAMKLCEKLDTKEYPSKEELANKLINIGVVNASYEGRNWYTKKDLAFAVKLAPAKFPK